MELSSENGEDFFLLLAVVVGAAEHGIEIGGVGRTVAVMGGARIEGTAVRENDVVIGVGRAMVVAFVDEFMAHGRL